MEGGGHSLDKKYTYRANECVDKTVTSQTRVCKQDRQSVQRIIYVGTFA